MSARADGLLDVTRPLAARRQQRPAPAIEVRPSASAPRRRPSRARLRRAVGGQEGRRQKSRQRRVAGEMREPGGDDRLGRFALNERHAERAVGMRQAEEDRQIEAVTPPFDPRREKAEQPARLRLRPDQYRAGVAPEHPRRRQREGGLIKHVGLERAFGQLAPFAGDRFELLKRAPFGRQRIRRLAIGKRCAAHAGDRRCGFRCKSQIGRCVDRHDRPHASLGPPKMKQCRPRRYLATRNRLTNSTTSATALAIAAPAIPSGGNSAMQRTRSMANAPA